MLPLRWALYSPSTVLCERCTVDAACTATACDWMVHKNKCCKKVNSNVYNSFLNIYMFAKILMVNSWQLYLHI